MRHAIRALCVALLLAFGPGRASAGASILEARTPVPRVPLTGVNFGFWASSSQPAGSSREVFDPSFKGGVSLTWMRGRSTGYGVAIDHCRWRSPATGAAFDERFSAISGTEIRGTEATMSGTRATFRYTEWLMPEASISPWVQAGAGFCRLGRKLVFPVDPLVNSGWRVSTSGTKRTSYQPILTGGFGIDLKTTTSMRIGFDLMGELIFIADEDGPFTDPVTAVTIGGHVFFGRWLGP